MLRTAATGLLATWVTMAGFTAPAAAIEYWDYSCSDLWFERNQIYKEAGYCFKTGRAISAFGNAGCRFDEIEAVPLSAYDRGRISQIVRVERARGCPR